ncbi:MAG: hypothetical protein NTZ01_01575 [Verrucomicrobia bacterium]|nr:hypothetical protein [Verrucomicrobiota bacterium]
MAEESAPPPAGGEVEPSKTKLRLKVTRIEEDKPRTRRRVITTVPAAAPGVEATAAVEEKRVGTGRILADIARGIGEWIRELDRNVWLWVGVAMGVMLLYGVWTEWRKTVVRVRVNLNEVRLGDGPEVLVLYDFSERLAGLRRDYGRRLAPIRPQIRELERTLILAKADAAGTAEKTRMVEQVLNQETTRAKTVYEDYRTSVSKLWLEEAGSLDLEFDSARKKFLEEVEVRAREVGLFYHPEEDADLQQPEIAANEYRLSLYRAPPSIKMPDQFGWIENKLSEWRKFEKDWNARYKGLGSRAKQLRSPASTSLDEKRERVGIQAKELDKFRGDAMAIRQEVAGYDERLKELREKEAQAKGPFEEDVSGIPDAFLCQRVPLDADAAEIVVQGKVAEAAPNTLRLVIRGKRNGQAAWAILPFEPTPHKRVEVMVKDADFQPVNDWLDE